MNELDWRGRKLDDKNRRDKELSRRRSAQFAPHALAALLRGGRKRAQKLQEKYHFAGGDK